MKRLGILLLFTTILIISGCFSKEDHTLGNRPQFTGNTPPPLEFEYAGSLFPTLLGSYCWTVSVQSTAECVETAGPIELLADSDPIIVQPEEEIRLMLDYKPEPNRFYLS